VANDPTAATLDSVEHGATEQARHEAADVRRLVDARIARGQRDVDAGIHNEEAGGQRNLAEQRNSMRA